MSHNTSEMGKSSACFLSFSFVSSLRGTGKTHNIRSRMDAGLSIHMSHSLSKSQTACRQKLFRFIHKSWKTASARERRRFHSSSESVFEFQCNDHFCGRERCPRIKCLCAFWSGGRRLLFWMRSLSGVKMW